MFVIEEYALSSIKYVEIIATNSKFSSISSPLSALRYSLICFQIFMKTLRLTPAFHATI